MATIQIAEIISPDLKSRSAVADLLEYVKSLSEKNVEIDFSNVQFATRSFIDEYFNTFINDRGRLGEIHVQSINLPPDISFMLNAVSKTQTGKKLYEEPSNTTVSSFRNVKELRDYLATLCL